MSFLDANSRCTSHDMIHLTFDDLLVMYQHNHHVLWASEDRLPDIGGAESDMHAAWSDPLKEPVVNAPAAYRSVSVEFEVRLYITDIQPISSLHAVLAWH